MREALAPPPPSSPWPRGGVARVAGAHSIARPRQAAPGLEGTGAPWALRGMPEAVCAGSPDLSLTQLPESSWDQGPE